MPHVLFHRPTVWRSEVQCSTKVLTRLFGELGAEVSYLQAPLDPVHLLRGTGGYLRVWRRGPERDGPVRVLTPATPVPVRDLWPLNTLAAARLRYGAAWPALTRLAPAPDLVWTTVPGSAAALRRAFPAARLVFHVIDYYPAFRGTAVRPLERSDYAAAGTVFTIGETLRRYLLGDLGVPAGKVEVLGQGVELERFAGPCAEPAALRGLPRPRAIWSGVLAKADPGLFRAAAEATAAAGGSLVLIGPPAGWAAVLAGDFPATVHLQGPVPATDLPGWLRHCDVGLMLYDRARAEVWRGQNPLKLYEYAAAGLAIVSTPHDEYAHLDPPAQVVASDDATRTALACAFARREGLRPAALAFAGRHSWRAKAATLFDRFLPDPAPAEGATA